MSVTVREVVDFWRDAGPERWFKHSETFDDMCDLSFADAHDDAASGALDDWLAEPDGALALVLLLDQIPRNIFRDDVRTWATDAQARKAAAQAIDNGFDQQVDPALRRFFYLPFMHSEDIDDQNRSVSLFQAMPEPDADRWALHHREIIERFGRFPHRNALLGRDTTTEEQTWLDQGGFKP